jgi:hypothetical protein
MRPFTRMFLLAGLVLLPAPTLLAQTAIDPSGHWEGAVDAPGMQLRFEVDLARNSLGELAGTVSVPAEKLRGCRSSRLPSRARRSTFTLARIRH